MLTAYIARWFVGTRTKAQRNAEREMEAYYRMFTDKLPGVGIASLNYQYHQWNLFLNSPTSRDHNNKPAFNTMSPAAQQRWAAAYFNMILFVSSFKQ